MIEDNDYDYFDAGKKEMQITIATRLLNTHDVQAVAEITELSVEDVQALQKNKKMENK